MINFEQNKTYIIIGILVLVVALYFIHTWHVNLLIDNKFRQLSKDRKKRQMRMEKQNQFMEQQINHVPPTFIKNDDDSYVEPRDDDDDEQNMGNAPPMKNNRLSKENVLVRDMVDGSQSH